MTWKVLEALLDMSLLLQYILLVLIPHLLILVILVVLKP
jgi:hypothetical protein